MRDAALRKKARLTPNPECYPQNDFGKRKLGKRKLGIPLHVIERKFFIFESEHGKPDWQHLFFVHPKWDFCEPKIFFMRLFQQRKRTNPRALGRLNYALWIDNSTKYNHHRRQFQPTRRFVIEQNLRYVKSSCHPCTGLPRSKNFPLRRPYLKVDFHVLPGI